MADGLVQVAPDSTGKKVDTSELTVGSNTVERQRVCLASDTVAGAIATVAQPGGDGEAATDYCLATESYLKAFNGTTWDRVRMFSAGGMQIAPAPAPAATTGAITTASTTVGPVTLGAYDGLSVVVSGTYAGVNFGFWGSNDNAVWFPVAAVRQDTGIYETATGVLTANQTRAWDVSIGEALYFRVVSTAWTSGSAAVNIMPGMFAAEPMVAAIAQGASAAATAIAGNPVRTGGTFTTTLPTYTTGQQTDTQTTARGELLVALSSGATAVAVKAASTAAATADPALVVSMAGANSAVKIGDGTNNAAVKAASTAAAATDPAVVVSLSPNSPMPATVAATQACTNINVNATGALAAVKASAGNLFGFSFVNNTAAAVFLSFWNVATGSVTLGTTAPTCVFVLPAGTGTGMLTVPPSALALLNSATAISFAAVTAYNGAVTASVTGSIFFK